MSETKHKIKVDDVEYAADGIWWEYPQTDGEGTGASDENVMYRDVLPERMKFGIKIISPSEERIATLLTMCKKKGCYG